MSAQLRDMTRDDIKAVVHLEQQLFPVDAWSAELFHQEIDEVPATRRVVVAVEADVVVGYASLRYVGSEGDVNTIAVDERHQRGGIGGSLMNWMESTAYDLGVRHLFLEVRSDNEPALAMYASRGYERIDRRRNYYASGVDALVMRKKLTA